MVALDVTVEVDGDCSIEFDIVFAIVVVNVVVEMLVDVVVEVLVDVVDVVTCNCLCFSVSARNSLSACAYDFHNSSHTT
jgi:hypothetical protein